MTQHASPERIAKALRLLANVEAYQEDRDRVQIARHEAGHAAMALSLGLGADLASMRLRYELRLDGHVRLTTQALASRRGRSDADRLLIERTALVYLAGGAADRLAGTHGGHRCLVDDQIVRDLLRAWPDPLDDTEQALLVAWWSGHVERRLVREWPAVVAIAFELLLHEEITGARLDTLYTDALGRNASVPEPEPMDPTLRHVA